MPEDAAAKAALPAAYMPGELPGSGRADGNQTSDASAPDQQNTQRSATPAAFAAPYEHMSTDAAWSTPRNAHIRLEYGSDTRRFSDERSARSAGVRSRGNQAKSLEAATLVIGDSIRPRNPRCSSNVRSFSWAITLSNIG